MVATYMLDCCLIGTKPCKYFQLNSPYFNNSKGIFSKLELDQLVPNKWRLHQVYDDGYTIPHKFPVFLKPEWGQNAGGIIKVSTREELVLARKSIKSSRISYLIQECASYAREFEIFFLADYKDRTRPSVFSVTEVLNNREENPVNSIHNPDTHYVDVTSRFSEEQKQTLSGYIGQIGSFSISRLSVRTADIKSLLNGKFQVIELNLFTPMPIHMLDPKYSYWDLWIMIREYMMLLARLTKIRDKTLEEKPVFTKMTFYNRENSLINFIRDRV